MRSRPSLYLLTILSLAMAGTTAMAQDAGVEQIKDVPSEYRAMVARTTTSQPTLSAVFFFEAGTNTNLQSVPAGESFDIVVYLNMRATSNVDVTLVPFRLDLSGAGSGDVKVIPIVTGSGSDEKYWASPPPSPATITAGNFGVRLRGVKVLKGAKQPPEGNVTMPFKPVKFPDHVIMIAKNGDVTLAPTLRIAKP